MSERTYEDIEADVKVARGEIAGLEDQQLDSVKFREEIDEGIGEFESILQNVAHFTPKIQSTISVHENAVDAGRYVYNQGNLLIEDALNDIAVKIEVFNQQIETYGAEMKVLRENEG